ncbi:MAG: hypothetical protein EXR99_15970 [Gemmataceae bacterium]|nr:hypothetical protein [Gemmataceae bacterium]
MWYSLLLALLAPAADSAGVDEPVTFNRQIAPILWKHCVSCHRPGEIGPFSLLTYKDAAKRADFLASVTAERSMPPWKPAANYGHFVGERRLSQEEIDLISRWAKAGALEGSAKFAQPPPKFVSGWQLGEPDLILQMPKPYKISGKATDLNLVFLIPKPFQQDADISHIELRPGNPKVVHHALVLLDRTGKTKSIADRNEYGYPVFDGPGIQVTGALGFWSPAKTVTPLPPGIGRHVTKNDDVILQIHYHPNGKDEEDRTQVGIYFTKTPALKKATGLGLRTKNIDIPAGKKDHQSRISMLVPADCHALEIAPHMHYLGREMKTWVETPDGKEIPLVWIKDWDFNWQGSYSFAKPIALPKNSRIISVVTYDNSEDNPNNPNTPPKRITWGEGTKDEMHMCPVLVYPDNPADLAALIRISFLQDGGLAGMQAASANVRTSDLIPPGGIAIPENSPGLRWMFDKNKDGKFTAEEIDAMPVLVRNKVKDFLQKKQAGKKP